MDFKELQIFRKFEKLYFKHFESSPCLVFPQNEPVNGQKSAPYLPTENKNNKNNIKWSPNS